MTLASLCKGELVLDSFHTGTAGVFQPTLGRGCGFWLGNGVLALSCDVGEPRTGRHNGTTPFHPCGFLGIS